MSSSHRALVARSFALTMPLLLAAVAGGFGGCSNLVGDIGNDAGSTPAGDDAGSSPTTDGGPILIDTDGDTTVADTGPAPPNCTVEDASFGAPNDLQCTGLYDDFATRTIAATVQAYDPALHLWADGATVARFILLPQGAKIDTSQMNEWTFPVGTKTWQEFQISGHRVETRFYWKRGTEDWVRGTYVWADDGSGAVYTTTGVTNVGGSSYDIPAVADCDTCHSGRIDRILGFEAVSLAQNSATGLTLSKLVSAGQITVAPASGGLTIPDDGTGLAAPALAWMHANCGTSCHSSSPGATAASTGFLMRLEATGVDAGSSLGDVAHTSAYVTGVNVTPQLAPYSAEGWHRITPNDSFDGGIGTSLVSFMAGSRNDPTLQMPPIASSVADITDVNALKKWITSGVFPAGSFPQ